MRSSPVRDLKSDQASGLAVKLDGLCLLYTSPVMGFCTPEQTEIFLNEVTGFEQSLIRGGTHIIKFWLAVSQDEQRRRFRERRENPLKRWKYHWPASFSVGFERATVRAPRGLRFSVKRRIVPPLPAASRPSKSTMIFEFVR